MCVVCFASNHNFKFSPPKNHNGFCTSETPFHCNFWALQAIHGYRWAKYFCLFKSKPSFLEKVSGYTKFPFLIHPSCFFLGEIPLNFCWIPCRKLALRTSNLPRSLTFFYILGPPWIDKALAPLNQMPWIFWGLSPV